MSLVHASSVAFGKTGVLIRGEPGSGKSSLCLRLIDGEGFGLGAAGLRAKLVADDQVELSRNGNDIWAAPPAALAGKLEIHGLGIASLAYAPRAQIRLVVDLMSDSKIERLPLSADLQADVLGVALPRIFLDAKTAVAPAKLRAALGHFGLL